jgi:hemolysin activation/secretion protein
MYIHIIILNDLKTYLKLLFLIVFTTSTYIQTKAQSFELKIYSKDSVNSNVIDSIAYKSYYTNKKAIYKEIDSISGVFSTKGFINNTYTLIENDTVINCYFTLNKRLSYIHIYYKDTKLAPELLKKIATNYNNQYFIVSTKTIENTLNTITKYYEKQGYTFIKASLKNLNLNNDTLKAELNLETSFKRTINAIVIQGYDNFPKKYLKHYLGIKKNTVFSTNLLQETTELINTIPFITQLKNPEVLFTKDSTSLYFYVTKKNTNQFDGIIGFSNTENKSLTVNGYLNLNLNNIFNKGEQIDINWKNNGAQKTTLKLNLNVPYIIRSKFSINGTFNIYKQDSLYNTTNTNLKLIYNLNKNQSISSIASFENSEVLNVTNINDIETFNKKLFGFSYSYKSQAFKFKNKFSIVLNYLAGTRTTLSTSKNQSKGLAIVNYLWNLNNKNKIFIQNTTEFLNSSKILENELFQIGGVNSIRGFDDQSILTSNYNVTNVTYRFYTNASNYLYSISDFGFIENKLNNTSNSLVGFGVGYNFKSNNSIVNISYAIGKTEYQAFKINNGKIHIKLSYNF